MQTYPVKGLDAVIERGGMNLKTFRIAATVEAAQEIEELRKKLGFNTHAALMEWAIGVGRACVEAQEAGGTVQIVYKKRRRWWWPFSRRTETYIMDTSPE